MKQPRKSVSLNDIAGGTETALREIFIEQPKAWLKEAREKLRDLPKTNYDLGLKFADQGKWFDAAFRFRVTLKLKPNYPRAAYNLGCCYVRLGKLKEAKAALLEAQKLTPNNNDVIFMLATIDPKTLPVTQRPSIMPTNLVTGFFTSVANGYDVAEAESEYQAGAVMHDFAAPTSRVANPVVLDLGCGSGIAARPWRAMAASVHGIDMTPAMLTLAEKATQGDKKLYDTLLLADVAELASAPSDNMIDVMLMVNVAQFIGDLVPVMQGIAKSLKADGIAAITTEPYGVAGEFGLDVRTSRFGHSPEYVKQVAGAVGLTLLKEEPVELYRGIPAQGFVFSKRND